MYFWRNLHAFNKKQHVQVDISLDDWNKHSTNVLHYFEQTVDVNGHDLAGLEITNHLAISMIQIWKFLIVPLRMMIY